MISFLNKFFNYIFIFKFIFLFYILIINIYIKLKYLKRQPKPHLDFFQKFQIEGD